VTPGQLIGNAVSSHEKYLEYFNGEEKFGEINILTLGASKGMKD
jgi:hypothetical protein